MATATRRRRACETIAAPRCVVDVLARGENVVIQKRGKSFYLQQGEIPLARRATRKTARTTLEAAQVLARQASCPPCAPVAPAADELRRTRVVTPQRREGEAARFELVEAEDLVASHNPRSFAPDPRYPANVQERPYHSDVNEQVKVQLGAQRMDPTLVLARTPTPTDGPPLVTEDLRALGGNGRSMMIKRAYLEGGAPAERYREALRREAPQFGFTVADVDRFRQPVLVRVIEGFWSTSTPQAELVAAVRRYNESLTNALEVKARAVAQGKLLSADTVRHFGEVLQGSDASLRDLMRAQPELFIRALENDGIITSSNRSEWVAGGELTDGKKDAIEEMFLGRILGTVDRFSATAPSLRRKLERAVPYLLAVAGQNPAFDLIPAVQEAVDLLNDAARRGLPLEGVLAQVALFAGGQRSSPIAVDVARMLAELGQKAVGERFRAWSRIANFDPRQATMFGTPPTLEEALAALLLQPEAPMRASNPCPCPPKKRVAKKVRDRAEDKRYELERMRRELAALEAGPAPTAAMERSRPTRIAELKRDIPSVERHLEQLEADARGCTCRRPNPDGSVPPALAAARLGELRVTVARDNEGRAHPALVRMGPKGLKDFQAVGEPAKTSFEAALGQARSLAKKLGLMVEVDGMVELPSRRAKNPSAPSFVQVLRSKAKTFEQLADELVRKLPSLDEAVAVLLEGSDDLIRLELAGGKVRRARKGSRAAPAVRTALNRALAVKK